VPPPKGDVSEAKGGFTATINRSFRGTELRWRLEWEGMTSRVPSSHIHVGPRGKIGRVIILSAARRTTPAGTSGAARSGSSRLRHRRSRTGTST